MAVYSRMEREVVRIVTPGTITDEALLEERRERTGLSSMKLGFNGVQGFFIEINRSQAERAPKESIECGFGNSAPPGGPPRAGNSSRFSSPPRSTSAA